MAHGFSVQGGLGAGGSVIPHDSSAHDSSAHSVLVPDTELLFTAQFHRAGPDLVLTGRDGQHHLIPGYFSSEHHPALVAPNGAHLSPDTVDLLAGSAMPGHYAQAQPTAPPDSIGKIEKVVGDVTVVRNGVSLALHVGDAVFKSDVVATGSSSSCGISFPDGTALNLVANTRMALNDYAFDANSNSNGALFTLVEGTFAFVAGKVAHQGDMKIATPVATMGIRGTTGVVQEQPNAPATITATAADHTYGFAVVPDIGTGITGMWDVYLTDANGVIQRDANGNPIVLATVSQSGFVTYLTPQGPGERPLVSVQPATNSQYAFEQEMLSDLFRTLNPANLNNNNNNGGSSTQPPPFQLPNPIPQLFEDNNKPFTIDVPNGANPNTPTIIDIVVGPTGPLTVVIWTASASGSWSSGPNWLGGLPPTSPEEVEILNPVKVTTDGADSAAGLVINPGATLNIVSGTSFTIYDFIHGGGTIQLNGTGSDPTLFVHGTVSLVGGGTIKMLGPAGEDNILGVPGTGALLLNIDYTIEGTGTIGGGDGNLTFENFGTVNANDGLLTIDTGNQVYNDGLMEATADPLAATAGTLAIKDSVANAGTVQADGAGAAVSISGATFDNLFSVVAKNGGTVTFTDVAVTNEAVSATDPAGGTINADGGTITFDGGSIANGNLLEATNGGTLQLENLTVTNSAAGELSIDAQSELDLMSATVIGGNDTNLGNVVVTDGASVLHGDSVTNYGTMTVEAGASLRLEGDTTLINEAGGLIKADGGTVAIELDTDTNVNSGTIEAVNGGEVDFYVNVDGGSNHGLIEAGAGGIVHFFDTHGGGGGGGPQGGNYGTMEATDGGVLIFGGGIDNFDLVGAFNGGLVYLNNGIKNHAGTVDAAGSGSQIFISGGNQSENASQILAEHDGVISLASVVLKNDAGAMIEAASGGSISWITGGIDNFGTFSAGNTGTITFTGVDFTNESSGSIEAASGGAITFTFSLLGSASVTNDGGMIKATQGGTITFEELLGGIVNENGGVIEAGTCGTITISGVTSVANSGGIIEAIGTDATVDLDGAIINDGTIKTSDGGLIEASNYVFFSNVTIADGSIIDVIDDAGSLLGLGGTTTIDGTVTFEGGGEVFNTTGSQITGGSHGGTLINETTIAGVGTIGGNDLVLDNRSTGTIDAGDDGGTLTIHTGNTVTNAGTLEATNGGTLQIDDAVTNSNMIEAHDLGSAIVLAGGGSNSGTIKATGGGSITIDNDNNSSIFNSNTIQAGDGGTITINNTNDSGIWNSGTIEALTGGTLNIYDLNDNNIKNTGTLEADGGTINITHDHSSVTNENLVEAINGGTINITNINNGDISGGGNAGTQKADGGTINVHGGAANLSGGTIEAINGGTFDIFNGGLNNAGGTAEAGSGGTFDIDGGLNNANGAKVEALAGGTVNIDGGTVVNSGTIEQIGTGALEIDASVQNKSGGIIEADGGTLSITGGASSHNAGTIEAIDGGTLAINTTTIGNTSGTISASGANSAVDLTDVTINGGTLASSDGGVIDALTGTSTFDGVTIAGGFIKAESGATVDLEDTTTISGTVTLEGGGTFVLDAPPKVASIVAGATGGTLDIAAGATLTGSGDIGNDGATPLTLNNAGTIDADGHCAAIDIDTGSTVTNLGILEATRGGILEIDDDVCNIGGTIAAYGCVSVVELEGVTIKGGMFLTDDSTAGDRGVIEVANTDAATVFDGGSGHAVSVGGFVHVVGGASLELLGTIDLAAQSHNGTIDLDVIHVADSPDIGADLVISGTVTLTGAGAVVMEGDAAQITAAAPGATLHNAATIVGAGSIGVGDGDLTLVNESCGVINANNASADNLTIDTGCNTVVNHGILEATGGATLVLNSDVDNSCGTIQAVGCDSTVNIHEITVSHGTLETSCDGRIQIVGGATLDGVHVTDNGALDIGDDLASGTTLMLDDGTGISGCGAMTINVGNTLDVTGGTSTINLGGTITNNGTIEASGGGTLDIQSHVDNGSGALLATSGGVLDIESAICGGTATIDHGTLEFGAKSDVDVTFHNSHGYGELILDDAAGFSGKIFCFTGTDAGLSNSDEVFLTGVQEGEGGLTANYCSADNITTVIIDEQGGGSITLKFVGDYDADNFKLQQDANGLEIYDPPAGGGKQAPPKVTTAGADHTGAPTNQIPHVTDHATTSPSSPSGFGGNQNSTPGASTSEATSHDNELAAPADQHALGGKPVIASLGAPALGGGHADGSFVNGVAGVGAGEVGAATLTNVGVSTQSLLSSLLKTLTGGTDGTAPSIDLDSGHGQGQAALAPALATTAPANEHTIASAHITSLPAAPPTAASASFQIVGNDSFAFHANLGGNPAQNTDAHTGEIAHNNGQISGPTLASTAPEFHQEFAFDAIHQDIANLAATVDQFHQMASNSTLLH